MEKYRNDQIPDFYIDSSIFLHHIATKPSCQ